MTDNTAKKIEIEKLKPLHPNAMLQAEYAYTTYHIVPPTGTTIKDMEDPAFWCHVAQKLAPGHRIEVDAEDGSFYAKFKVVYTERMAAHVVLLHHTIIDKDILPDVETERKKYNVRFNGPVAKWGIIRHSDKVLLEGSFETKDEANTWLDEYIKAPGK